MDEHYDFPLPQEFGVEEVVFLAGADDVVKGGTVRAWGKYSYLLEQFRYPWREKKQLRGRFFLAVAGLILCIVALRLWAHYLKGAR